MDAPPTKLLRVKAAIVATGTDYQDFAPRVGVAPATLSNVLNGHAHPWPALRHRIADALGIPEAELFEDPESEQ